MTASPAPAAPLGLNVSSRSPGSRAIVRTICGIAFPCPHPLFGCGAQWLRLIPRNSLTVAGAAPEWQAGFAPDWRHRLPEHLTTAGTLGRRLAPVNARHGRPRYYCAMPSRELSAALEAARAAAEVIQA